MKGYKGTAMASLSRRHTAMLPLLMLLLPPLLTRSSSAVSVAQDKVAGEAQRQLAQALHVLGYSVQHLHVVRRLVVDHIQIQHGDVLHHGQQMQRHSRSGARDEHVEVVERHRA